MRKGYEWWEEFWKYLLIEAQKDTDSVIPYFMHADNWLRAKYKEFDDLWNTGQVELPPLRESIRVPPKLQKGG